MDFITDIVDMLRNGKDEKAMAAFPRSGPRGNSKPAPASELVLGGLEVSHPGYTAYKREAEAMGEPVMSPQKFKQYQAEK